MVGLDKRWPKAHAVVDDRIAGLVPLSGQAITHFTFRAERGIADKGRVIDALAPLYHVRKDAPPLLFVTGDRNRELLGRSEENAHLWRMMKEAGHPDIEINELPGYDHGGRAEPAFPLLVRFVQDRANAPPPPNDRRRRPDSDAEAETPATNPLDHRRAAWSYTGGVAASGTSPASTDAWRTARATAGP